MQVATGTLVPAVGPQDHIRGPVDARVTLVEYGDYQCPYCGLAFESVQSVQSALANEMRFVFRHFPLVQIHPHAQQAAEAAEAAGAQGKFWEMHDMLFTHQDALDLGSLRRYAAEIGLDILKFDEDIEGHRHLPKIMADYQSGIESGVEGTPTFFIDGEIYTGDYDSESLRRALESASK